MVIANFSKIRSNMKRYCDFVVDSNEEVMMERPKSRNVVLINENKYRELIEMYNEQNSTISNK